MGAIAIALTDPNTIYAGTGEANNASDSFYGRGILKSTDAGATWTLLGNSVFDRRSISKIVIGPTNANIVYATVGGSDQPVRGHGALVHVVPPSTLFQTRRQCPTGIA